MNYKTYEITLAWRDTETGELDPEFSRTQIAWSEGEAIEIVTTAVETAAGDDPFAALDATRNARLELRGVRELVA